MGIKRLIALTLSLLLAVTAFIAPIEASADSISTPSAVTENYQPIEQIEDQTTVQDPSSLRKILNNQTYEDENDDAFSVDDMPQLLHTDFESKLANRSFKNIDYELVYGSGEGEDERDYLTRAEWIHNLINIFRLDVGQDEYPDQYYSDFTSEDEYYDEDEYYYDDEYYDEDEYY